MPHLDVVLRTSTVYLFLIVGLRIAGKREMGQMTVFDLAVILVLSNAVQNAMVGPDTSLAGGLLAAATLLVLNHLMSWLRYHFRPIARWLGGLPTVIIEDGRYDPTQAPGQGAQAPLGSDSRRLTPGDGEAAAL